MIVLGWYWDQHTLYPVCQSIPVRRSKYDSPNYVLGWYWDQVVLLVLMVLVITTLLPSILRPESECSVVSISMCMYVHMYVCMYVRMYVSMYVCM